MIAIEHRHSFALANDPRNDPGTLARLTRLPPKYRPGPLDCWRAPSPLCFEPTKASFPTGKCGSGTPELPVEKRFPNVFKLAALAQLLYFRQAVDEIRKTLRRVRGRQVRRMASSCRALTDVDGKYIVDRRSSTIFDFPAGFVYCGSEGSGHEVQPRDE